MKRKLILFLLPILCSCSFKYNYEVPRYDLIGTFSSDGEYVLPLNTSVFLQMYNQDELDLVKKLFKNKILDIHQLVDAYHQYDDVTNIYTLNNLPSNTETVIEENLFNVIKYGIDITKLSKGIFNISMGNVIDLWKPYFNEENNLNEPSSDEINTSLLSVVNYQEIDDYIVLNEEKSSILIKDYNDQKININLGGISKGYALDQVSNLFINNEPAIISAGGSSISLKGEFPLSNRKHYLVNLREPLIGKDIVHNEYLLEINVDKYHNISTSGIDQKYFYNENNDIRHHILSSSTGYSENYHRAVTILSTCESYILDSLSTILMNIKDLNQIKSTVSAFENFYSTEIDYCIVNTNTENTFNLYINEGFDSIINKNKYSSKINKIEII